MRTSSLKQEDGFITVALVLLLSLLILVGTYRVELAKLFAIRTQMHTACDAASLAGASTAAAIPADITYSYEMDADGNYYARENVGRWIVAMDKNQADTEGLFAAQLNYANFNSSNWTSAVNQDRYTFRMYGIPFKSPLTVIWNTDLFLKNECTSRAVHR